MQDTLDITGAGNEYDFVWLHTGYSILVQLKDFTPLLRTSMPFQS